MSNTVEKIENIIKKVQNKEYNIYFFTIDTKGTATAAVGNIYETVKILNELGYNAHIIHDKEDYTSVASWMGEEYAELPHKLTKEIMVDPSDVIVVPEVFANVMEQLAKYPCKKVVYAQSYSYMFELLKIGTSWNYDYGFKDAITTSKSQAEYIQKHFPNIKTHVAAPSIPEYFNEFDKPQKPIVGIVARDQTDVLSIIKSFYLQYPMYKWITFKDLRGLSRQEFANELKQNCLSVWVDDIASFGTFPLESMKCNVPVLGKVPDMVPEWMITETEEGITLRDNGIWTDNVLNIPNLISEYIRLWLEDSVPEQIYTEMAETKKLYTPDTQKKAISDVFETLRVDRVEELNKSLNEEKSKETDEQEQK